MEYRIFEDTVVVRLDKGEEICQQLLLLAEKEQIAVADISGIGAVDDLVVGLYDPDKRCFLENHLTGYHEVTNLCGNLTTMNGKPYLHLHMTCADAEGHTVGGHLAQARISLTGEIFLHLCCGKVERTRDEQLGLNVFSF